MVVTGYRSRLHVRGAGELRNGVEHDDEAEDEADDEDPYGGHDDGEHDHAALTPHPASAPSSWSTCSAGFTSAKTCSMRPSGPITNVLRSTPMYVLPRKRFSTQTP